MTTPLYVIKHDGRGAGGFLCPPGHPAHEYSLEGYWNGKRKANADMYGSIEYVFDPQSGASDVVRDRVRKIMDSATLVCSENWVRMVYGYFRNCYATEDGDRSASDCIIPKKGDAPLPDERHLGYLTVREYFPDHEPRHDLIEDPDKGYGSWPCVKCGLSVQYEARYDAFVVYPAGKDCPKGGQHERESDDGTDA